jgi:polyhydroxybutyrate depolymerase
MKKQLLVGLGCVVLLGAGLFIAAKFIRAKLALLPRGDAHGYLQVGNLKRAYDLHVPSSYNSQKPIPLVLAFHGVGADGKGMAKMTGLSQLAEQSGFIVVYPDAIRKHWDARRGSQPETTNDVGFISALIDDLGQRYTLDRRRIYVTGFSNGGTFAFRVACELSNKITAFAAISATMPENVSRTCKPVKPMSVLLMHGTKDSVIPYGPPGRALLSLADTVKYWTTHNRCSPQAVKQSLPKSPHIRLDTYQQCTNETAVKLYSIEGAEHGWGDTQSGTTGTAGKPSQEANTSAIIWDFFSKQSAK